MATPRRVNRFSRTMEEKVILARFFFVYTPKNHRPIYSAIFRFSPTYPAAGTEGFLIIATRVRLNEFNHQELACDVARDFRVAYREVETLYGGGAARRIPLFGVGHSLGAKVHMLLNCYPEVAEVAKRRKVRCFEAKSRFSGGAFFFLCFLTFLSRGLNI